MILLKSKRSKNCVRLIFLILILALFDDEKANINPYINEVDQEKRKYEDKENNFALNYYHNYDNPAPYVDLENSDFFFEQILDSDKGNCFLFFIKKLYNFHVLTVAFCKNTLITPPYLRVGFFFLNLILLLNLNSLLFTEDYLIKRITNTDVKDFVYTMKNEYLKSVLAIIITYCVMIPLRLLMRSSESIAFMKHCILLRREDAITNG